MPFGQSLSILFFWSVGAIARTARFNSSDAETLHPAVHVLKQVNPEQAEEVPFASRRVRRGICDCF